MLACNALSSGTGFSREGGISDSKDGVDVLASSRLKPVPHENASVGARLARDAAARCVRQTALPLIVGMPPRPSSLLQTDTEFTR
jgi:hypothetical protein